MFRTAGWGYLTAAATESTNTYGILITRSTSQSSAAAQTVALGRCWHAGDSATVTGQVLVRDSSLGGTSARPAPGRT